MPDPAGILPGMEATHGRCGGVLRPAGDGGALVCDSCGQRLELVEPATLGAPAS